MADLSAGTILDDKYLLQSKIGDGGMSSVYRAKHIQMEHSVAVKVLHSHLASDQNAVERFRREARAAVSIRHPNVVSVLDFGVTKDQGIAYFVMELLEGEDLRETIGRKKQLEYEEAFSILSQVCSAAQAAHDKGIIHRDLKPDNIWIVSEGNGVRRVKVLDFGIAKLAHYTENTLTLSGAIVGTPYYMSPEQCRGENLDARSDIYSLGLILYEMLTGKVPFEGTSAVAILLEHNTATPKPLREFRDGISDEVEAVVLRALEKKPEDRQSSAVQLATEFGEALHISPALGFKTVVGTKLEMEALGSALPPVTEAPADSYRPAPTVTFTPAPAPEVVVDKHTVHLKSPDVLADTDGPSPTVKLRHSRAFRHDDEHLFEELILHKDYERLWRSLIHAGGGRNLLTGYGPFGGTSLVRCAIAKARSELDRGGRTEGALLVFYFRIANESADSFEIEATNFGLGHLKKPDDIGYNSDLNELKARADRSNPEGTSSVLDLPLDNPLGAAFFDSPETSNLSEAMKQHYNFSELVADLNAFFKQRKSNKALRQIVLRLVRSEFLPSRVVIIIDRVKHLQTLEALFRSELFSNRRIRVIAVARKEDFDSWEDAELRLDTIGFSKWYVPGLWKIDWDKSLFSTLSDWRSDRETQYELFLKHLMYVGRGSLGNVINELRHPMNTNYDDNTNFIDFVNLTDRAEVQHNAWIQEVLHLNWDAILGDLFGGRDQDERTDRARVGVYHVIDWISRKTRFSEHALIGSLRKFPVAISDDDDVTIETIRNLLYVLTRNRYLNLKDGKYHIVWNKKRPPTCRRVHRRPANRQGGDDAPAVNQPEGRTQLLGARPMTVQPPASGPTSSLSYPQSASDAPAAGGPASPNAPEGATHVLSAPPVPLGAPAPHSETRPLQSDPAGRDRGLTQEPNLVVSVDAAPQRGKIFVSYSHADRKWLEKLHVHLKPIERTGSIELWDDTRIKVGARWRKEIEEAIAASRVAILLISANFLASDFIAKDELPPLLAHSETKGTIIMALILSPCMFLQTNLSQVQAFNPPSRPLTSMNENQQEELLVQVAEAIREAFSG